MRAITDALWVRYRADGDPEARRGLLDAYIGLVHHSARELIRRLSADIELDDLIGAGTLGLVQALEGFEPERGLAFSTYAMPRIRGAMFDELRAHDWMPRSVRVRSRQLNQARALLQQRLGRAPSAEEMARQMNVELTTYWRWAAEAEARVMLPLEVRTGTDDECDRRLSEAIPDHDAEEPGAAILKEESLDELREAFASLAPKDRLVLSLYYYEDLSLKEIGELLHVTESRISQIRSRALQRLRGILAPQGETR
jgi:RNA polymerase sigma factor for flagellar operon FliA